MNFSTEPMVTAPWPENSITQLPSHRRSCGQMRPQISGMVEVRVRQFIGFAQPALGGQPQPVGDVVVQRAMHRAIGHAALRAARGLVLGAIHLERVRNLAEVLRALGDRALVPDRTAYGSRTSALDCRPSLLPLEQAKPTMMEIWPSHAVFAI